MAVLDLNCAEAAMVVRKALHEKKLDNFANTLTVEDWKPPKEKTEDHKPSDDKAEPIQQ